jgi:RNA polymerase sigma-70 factor (ECF subfamily)
MHLSIHTIPGTPTTTETGPLEHAMAKAAAGDDHAFAAVYTAVARRVFRTLCRRCGSEAVAEDLTQETMLRLYRARASYRAGARVLPWAVAIARRLHVDHVRRSCRERNLSGQLGGSGLDASAQDALEAKQLGEIALAAIAELPPRQALMFKMVRAEGQSLEEAARELGVTPIALRVGVHRACKAVKEALRAA